MHLIIDYTLSTEHACGDFHRHNTLRRVKCQGSLVFILLAPSSNMVVMLSGFRLIDSVGSRPSERELPEPQAPGFR